MAVEKPLGPLDLNLVVDPAKAGRNAIHLYLLKANGQPAAVAEANISASLPSRRIGPLRFKANGSRRGTTPCTARTWRSPATGSCASTRGRASSRPTQPHCRFQSGRANDCKTIPVLVAAAALVAVPAAWGHVTVNPNQVPAGSEARFDVRVPNEEQSADTTKLTVQFPEGVNFVSFQPKAGWTRTVTMKKLAKPVTSDDGTVTERVATVSWSGGKIAPGEFDEFGFSATVPDTAGAVLVFPTVQTYSNGKVVHWVGNASADEPAPRVTLTAAASGDHMTTTTTAAASSSDSSDNSRANVALVLGAVGLAAGIAALGFVVAGRRRG